MKRKFWTLKDTWEEDGHVMMEAEIRLQIYKVNRAILIKAIIRHYYIFQSIIS